MVNDLDCDRYGLGLAIHVIVGVVVFSVFDINMTTRIKNNSRILKIAIDLS